jgi:hypothetical protein
MGWWLSLETTTFFKGENMKQLEFIFKKPKDFESWYSELCLERHQLIINGWKNVKRLSREEGRKRYDKLLAEGNSLVYED